MANTLGFYNPEFFANEALIQLEEAMGMAGRVHLGYDAERDAYGLGDTINIKRPSVFTALAAPSTAQDLETESVSILLDQWYEVKFKVSDKEFAYTQDRIIADHIRPAARALASKIDADLCGLAETKVPWYVDGDGGADGFAAMTAVGIINARKIMADNKVPMDGPDRVHLMVNPASEASLLNQQRFVEQQGAGDAGINAQRTASLGAKYGLEIFMNQNVVSHTKGTTTDVDILVNNSGGYPKGTTTLNFDAAGTGTIVPGDLIKFAGHSQRYVIQNTVTAATNAFTGVQIFPALKAAVADDEGATLYLDSSPLCLAFHRNAFALAMARLPGAERLRELGARVASVQHPNSGVALRSRMYYVGNSSEVHVALDVLYGVKTLDPNLAVRIHTT